MRPSEQDRPETRPFRWRGFADAFRGVLLVWRTQPNTRVHAGATLLALGLGGWLGLSAAEWAILALAIAAVWVSEALNTAIECTVDLVTDEQKPLAGWAKDAAAGAVLIAATAALVVGSCLFGPKLVDRLWP